MKLRKPLLRRLKIVGLALGLILLSLWPTLRLLDWYFPFPKELLNSEQTSLRIKDCHGHCLMTFVNTDEQWHFPIPVHEVDPDFLRAIVSAEDKNFYRHGGIDWIAIVRAFGGNISGKRRRSGASTITMQTIRLLLPRQKRDMATKLYEAFRAWQLEKILSKNDILELYINRTPYGGNLIGVEAAAQKYFSKHASELSLAEAALLAGLPQSPVGLRPDRHWQRALDRRAYVLTRMRNDHAITQTQFDEASATKPTLFLGRRPFLAPHFCFWIKGKQLPAADIITTLDFRIQQLTEQALAQGLQNLAGKGIENGAVVVIENGSDAVRALVGSSDFFSQTIQGQVNSALQPRSPGSALKPFTFGLALDAGLITPATTLIDLPYLQTAVTYENYDRTFRGPVAAGAALSQSLNLPAIRLLEQIGVDNLLQHLRQAGLTSLPKSAEHYGLGLTLGGCEVSLLELTAAYASLARLGVYRPLRFSETEPVQTPIPILSPAATYLLNHMLGNLEPLKAAGIAIPTTTPPFSWKTGTSSHQKDAWALVYNPRFTIGVWVGNMDGRPSPDLIGIQAAAPIAVALFLELMQGERPRWYDRPADVVERKVCAVSGRLPAAGLCPEVVSDLAIGKQSSETRCSIHKRVEIDRQTGQTVCRLCREQVAANGIDSLVCETWEAQTDAWLRSRRYARLAPSHRPGCDQAIAHDRIVILTPLSGSDYLLTPEIQASHQIELRAVCGSARRLYWFEDGVLLGEVTPGNGLLHTLRPGAHRLTCSDEHGRESSIQITVNSQR